jgi:hypothetical protein
MKFKSVSQAIATIAFVMLAGMNLLLPHSRANEIPIEWRSVSEQQPIRLAGGFIQYTDKTLLLAPDKWKQLITRMNSEAGMNTIIIQRLASPPSRVPDTGVPLPDKDEKGKYTDHKYYEADLSDPHNPKDAKPTEQILHYADDHGMEVYIGLWDDDLSLAKINDNYLKGVETKYLSIAKEVWPLYRKHKSFKGWYLPLEIWNHADAGEKIDLLNSFITRVIAGLRQDVFDPNKTDPAFPDEKTILVQKFVAMSPYFVPRYKPEQNWLSSADDVRDIYFRIIHGTGLNVLMLQDGVGSRTTRGNADDAAKWQDLSAYLSEVGKYATAFRDACSDLNEVESIKIQFWANVESFEPGFSPTDIQRLSRQFQAQPSGIARFVSFDVYHYMNSVVPDGYGANGSLSQRKKLYCDYLQKVLNKQCSDH